MNEDNVTKAVDWMLARERGKPSFFKNNADEEQIILRYIHELLLSRAMIITPLAFFGDWRVACKDYQTALFVTADAPPSVAHMPRSPLIVSMSCVFRRIDELMIYAPELVITCKAHLIAAHGEHAPRVQAIERLERQAQSAWRFSPLYPEICGPEKP